MDNALVGILRVLIEGGGEAMSIRKVSRLGKVDYKTAYTGIRKGWSAWKSWATRLTAASSASRARLFSGRSMGGGRMP